MAIKQVRECGIHGEAVHALDKKAWRCMPCTSDRVKKHRQRDKERLVALHGGKCVRCGYSKSLWALSFHHRDPTTKDPAVRPANTVSWKRRTEEAAKCDLLCANCHAEEHEVRSRLV